MRDVVEEAKAWLGQTPPGWHRTIKAGFVAALIARAEHAEAAQRLAEAERDRLRAALEEVIRLVSRGNPLVTGSDWMLLPTETYDRVAAALSCSQPRKV